MSIWRIYLSNVYHQQRQRQNHQKQRFHGLSLNQKQQRDRRTTQSHPNLLQHPQTFLCYSGSKINFSVITEGVFPL